MRQLCEQCHAPQPLDWRPGDLCTHCGAAARGELLCFWCCRPTPAGNFCRGCGAETVAPADFGAARMLKAAGVDLFRIPATLAAFDPARLDHFRRAYQRHAAAVGRHADALAALEPRTLLGGWAAAWEAEWLPRLPLADDALAALEAAPAPPLAASLALLIELRTESPARASEAHALFAEADGPLRAEAALALTGWPAAWTPDAAAPPPSVLAALPEGVPRLIRLARFLPGAPPPPASALDHPDPDEAFYAALTLADPDRLRPALTHANPLRRYAAAACLTARGLAWDAIAAALPGLPSPYLETLLERLPRVTAPALRPALFAIAATATPRVRYLACRALCEPCPPEEALTLARLAQGDRRVYQALFQRAALPPPVLAELGAFLLARGELTSAQFGLADAAQPGHMPAGFAPALWDAADATGRAALCAFVELQLQASADPFFERFLAAVALGAEEPPARRAAWSTLSRWGLRFGFPERPVVRLEAAALAALFPSPAACFAALAAFLANPGEAFADILIREPVLHLLRDADPNILPLLAAAPAEAEVLTAALGGLLTDSAADFSLRLAALSALTLLAGVDTLRPRALAHLLRCQGTDLDYQAAAARRLVLSAPPSIAAPAPSSSAE